MMVVASVRSRPLGGQRGRMLVAASFLVVGLVAVGHAYQLGCDKLGVEAMPLQQFLMAALFHRFSVIQHYDEVGIAYGG